MKHFSVEVEREIKEMQETPLYQHYLRIGFTPVKAIKMLKRISETAILKAMQDNGKAGI